MDEKQKQAVEEIKRIAAQLDTTSLTRRDFAANSHLSVSTVQNWFGSWNRAVEAAGLIPTPSDQLTIDDKDLLREIIRLTEHLGKKPSMREMSAFGKFSAKPYQSRWGSWSNALSAAYMQYGFPLNVDEQIPIPDSRQFAPPPEKPASTVISTKSRSGAKNKVRYGKPMDFRGLRHAPTNEQGVVYLFGMVSKELGFLVEYVRTAYPDCEGKRCIDEKRQYWERVLIEFEFKSSNFREHGHNPDECDVIVCWIHDWQDCPLEVVELRSAIKNLSHS